MAVNTFVSMLHNQSYLKCTVPCCFILVTRVSVTASTLLQHQKYSMRGCRADFAPHRVDCVSVFILLRNKIVSLG